MLERLICSLLDTAGGDDNLEVIVSIDTDDPAWVDREPVMHSHVRYLRRERAITLGEKLNEMARIATGNILWFIANDMVMDTPNWPAKFREACDRLPNGIGVPFVKDTLHPGHSSYPLVTRKMMEVIGFFAAPFFPFWWIDSWQMELGLLTTIYFEIDVVVSAPDGRGKTHALIDLPFWVEFFEATRPMRMRDAVHLAEVAYGQESDKFKDVLQNLGARQKVCENLTRHLSSPEFLAEWGTRADSPPSPKYAAVKQYAELQMAKLRKETPKRPRIAIAVPSGRTWEATAATSIVAMAAYSAINGVECAILNVQSSDVSHGRNATVEIARKEGCYGVLFIDSDIRVPVDCLVRLLKHNQPIVGALYPKRVKDPDGTYPLLGKLAGPKPEKLDDGLHEALLMPGGLMFIRMEVFDRIGWPYYAFMYRWPGEDGLEAFKKSMRDTFYQAAPEDALAELDNTKFGQWLRNGGYTLGEFGDQVHTLSEDLMLCRRARRAGYKIFADLKLTGEIAHLGEIAVTCELGDDVIKLP